MIIIIIIIKLYLKFYHNKTGLPRVVQNYCFKYNIEYQ